MDYSHSSTSRFCSIFNTSFYQFSIEKISYFGNTQHQEICPLTMPILFSLIGNQKAWTKLVRNVSITPSKSFMVWRLIHHKMPTDDNVAGGGCYMPSNGNLCCKQVENYEHLFMQCPFATSIWNWLYSIIDQNINFNSILSIFETYDRGWSPRCKIVITSAIIGFNLCHDQNILNIIWYCRNNQRFNNSRPAKNAIIAMITSQVSISGSTIFDFVILKAFNVNTHHQKAPRIVEVIWKPPI